MKNRDWKIVYSSYTGVEKRAVEFLNQEIGGRILRDPGIYSVHVMACEKVGCALDKNAIVVGTWRENELIQSLVRREDVPEGGYLVRIMDNPRDPSLQIVVVAGDTPSAVLWGAIDFVDDGLPAIAPLHDGHHFETDIFEEGRLKPYESRRAPKTRVRSVFFWGHTVDDYETHFANLARLKFNEVIIWNEYPPVNARDVAECAHSWGLAVVWGFSWGWSTNCNDVDFAALDKLGDHIVDEWRTVWKPLGGDGIYFQSFTELSKDTIDGHPIADTVVGLVNKTCARIFAESPDERIEFGLHATSVRKRLDVIARVDPRVEIIWENCGGFPYNTYDVFDPAGEETFTAELLAQNRAMGLVFKCQAMLDWSRGRFNHQPGPYIMGRAGRRALEEDGRMLEQLWRHYTADWALRGEFAHRIVRMAQARRDPPVTMNLVGNLVGEIRFPTALVAELFWSADEPYAAILDRVMRRPRR